MEYRNIFLANPAHISVRREQLVIEQAEAYTIPLEDISTLLIESPQITLTARAAAALATHGVTVFFCDEKHLPCCQLLPINQFCRQRKLLSAQCGIGKPLQKQLWQQIVIQKIRNQARCLELAGRSGSENLRQMAGRVLSGDPDNREAVAAALYFPALFGDGHAGDDGGGFCAGDGGFGLAGAVYIAAGEHAGVVQGEDFRGIGRDRFHIGQGVDIVDGGQSAVRQGVAKA